MSPIARLLIPLLLASLVSCHSTNGGSEAGASPDAIGEIYGRPVTLAGFNAYVAGVAPPGGDQPPAQNQAELMSRLLDRYLDEELILREAERDGMTVPEKDVLKAMAVLKQPEEEAAGGAPGAEEASPVPQPVSGAVAARDRMKRALLVKKFREERILKGLAVAPDEIAAWYEEHKDDFSQPAHVVLRQILVDDKDAAKKIREELLKDPNRFEEIAAGQSMAPDRGRPHAYAEADLAPEIVMAAAAVPDGGITQVVSDAMGSRVFRVDKRQAARLIGLQEASDRIQVNLMQEKGKRQYDEFMDALRKKAGLVIHEERLPFTYRKRPA